MEESSNTRDTLSPVTSHKATPRPYEEGHLSGKMAKVKISPKTPRDRQLEKLSTEEDESFHEMDLFQQMEEEKIRYPGASGWAAAEERLFEILFLRQDLPMLPSNWDVDFRTVPISEVVFETSDEYPAIIYAHGKDFRATLALMRLIDLTSSVRTNIQTGLRRKVPALIKRELDKYISWAAQDGDYAHLRIVPNIMTEIVNTKLKEDKITEYIQGRMRNLARLQREFLREDRDPEFWDVLKPSIMTSPKVKLEPEDDVLTPERWKSAVPGKISKKLSTDELSTDLSGIDGARIKVEPGFKRRRPFPSPTTTDIDELAGHDEERPRKKLKETPQQEVDPKSTQLSHPPSPLKEPQTPAKITYRRLPPVVYGFFILNTSVLLLTMDSSKGDSGYVSFHVQTNFQDNHQSVWNALTVGMAVCLARDELRGRKEDFECLPVEVESDPDA
ncbi:Fc.00g091390.m01.CDS01 [Cosmosporella sp. VM-42]